MKVSRVESRFCESVPLPVVLLLLLGELCCHVLFAGAPRMVEVHDMGRDKPKGR